MEHMSSSAGHGCGQNRKNTNVGPRLGGPLMKPPEFNWEAEDEYSELRNFTLEINNIFQVILHATSRTDSNQ